MFFTHRLLFNEVNWPEIEMWEKCSQITHFMNRVNLKSLFIYHSPKIIGPKNFDGKKLF